MQRFIIHIYDIFSRHKFIAYTILAIITILLLLSLLMLTYKEDISDFLPLDENNQRSLSIYQDISGANNVYAIISAKDSAQSSPELLATCAQTFADHVEEADSAHYLSEIIACIDTEKMEEVSGMVYDNLPLFLNDADYSRIDSLLSEDEYIDRKMEDNKRNLLLPTSSMLAQSIARDPLGLFTPVLNRLSSSSMQNSFDSYDGYIITPDGSRAVVILKSAFGSSESDHNGELAKMLSQQADSTLKDMPKMKIDLAGGPMVAVGNSQRIKTDSILTGSIAGTLILLLLIIVFRNFKNILLILVSVAWGSLFAMGCISLFYDSVSIIVIGIASVILGIAINYPLHLIDHLKESHHPRSALREIISPLLVGNVTTVGAFLALVPLNAPALHDLGLFSSLLLIGTIVFVLLFLPLMVRSPKIGEPIPNPPKFLTYLSSFQPENNKWVLAVVMSLTVIFAIFSFQTKFDSDMRNINYVTPDQREGMAYFQSLVRQHPDRETLYVAANGDSWDAALSASDRLNIKLDSLINVGALPKGSSVSEFITSTATQHSRLDKWNKFVTDHQVALTENLSKAGQKYGFSEDAFQPFSDILERNYKALEFDELSTLTAGPFVANFSSDEKSHRCSVVKSFDVEKQNIESLKGELNLGEEIVAFDVASMNGAMTNSLSDDFNYIGFVCSFIVFIFLWISLGSIELAIVSFVPMAISWIWILGIMGMMGINFNIVNIILATFIFGQGDDYTIFMTEGLTYEYAHRKKLLASFKNSIVVSALIMFIGIGSLIFAKHPAMRSLGEVTVVGMLSVVLMAYLFPPLLFNFLVKRKGIYRSRPVTIKKLIYTSLSFIYLLTVLIGSYIYKGLLYVACRNSEQRVSKLRGRISDQLFSALRHLPGISYDCCYNRGYAENKIVELSNSKSAFAILAVLPLMPDKIIVNGKIIVSNWLVNRFMSLYNPVLIAKDTETIDYYGQDSVSIYVFGIEYVMADDSMISSGGEVVVGDINDSGKILSINNILPIIYDRYRYKGIEIQSAARRAIREIRRTPEANDIISFLRDQL